MKRADWWFDVISPYAYIAFEQFHRLPSDVEVTLRPVLFAGLLGKWGQLGPAEIPSKRLFTYQYSQWLAERQGVSMRYPEAHPFNPLPFLRLSIACNNEQPAVRAIFRSIWADGREVGTAEHFNALASALNIDDLGAAVSQPAVKAQLQANTDAATAAGVFGVPTFTIDGHLFWGVDAFDFFLQYLDEPTLFETESMKRATVTRTGVQRKQSSNPHS
ncbi:MAG: 2-hydroxychromene-2-carboxylate isomerase [Gammaproteobacteria bacterium]|nr:2-hydroxychromene-2-carboxylate isomerase [Gammaproteobacteria bacterium]